MSEPRTIWSLVVISLLSAVLSSSALGQTIRRNEAEQMRVLLRAALRNGDYERVADFALALIEGGYSDTEVTAALEESLDGLGVPAAAAIVEARAAVDPARQLVLDGAAVWLRVRLVDVPQAWRREVTVSTEDALQELGDSSLALGSLGPRLLATLGHRSETSDLGNEIEVRALWFRPAQAADRLLVDSRTAGRFEVEFGDDFQAAHVFSLGTITFQGVGDTDNLFIDGHRVPWREQGELISAGRHVVQVDTTERSGRDIVWERAIEVETNQTANVSLPPMLILWTPSSCPSPEFAGLESLPSVGWGAWSMRPGESYDVRVCCTGYEPVELWVPSPGPGEQASVFVEAQDLVTTSYQRRLRQSRWLEASGWLLTLVGVGLAVQSGISLSDADEGYGEFQQAVYTDDARALAEYVETEERNGILYASGGGLSMGMGATLIWFGRSSRPEEHTVRCSQ